MIKYLIKLILGVLVCILLTSSKDSYFSSPKATYYYAKKGRFTASGKLVCPDSVASGNHRWIAVSRDLLRKYSFGDTILINSRQCPKLNGEWVIQDLMPKQWKNKIDFLIHKDSINSINFLKPHTVEMRRK